MDHHYIAYCLLVYCNILPYCNIWLDFVKKHFMGTSCTQLHMFYVANKSRESETSTYYTQEIANEISIPIFRLLNSVYVGLFGQIQILRNPRIQFWNSLRCGTNTFRIHPINQLFLSVNPIKFSEFVVASLCILPSVWMS